MSRADDLSDDEKSMLLRAGLYAGWMRCMFIAQTAEQVGVPVNVGTQDVTFKDGTTVQFYSILME